MTNSPDPDALALARLALANHHGPLTSDESVDNYIKTRLLVSDITCQHCDVQVDVVPAGGAQWVVEQHHEHHCPIHDDNTPGLHHNTVLYPPAD